MVVVERINREHSSGVTQIYQPSLFQLVYTYLCKQFFSLHGYTQPTNSDIDLANSYGT